MAFPAQLLLPVLLPAEKVINAAIQVDELSEKRLDDLNGKVVLIYETTFDISVGIAVVDRRVQLLNQFDGESDVVLRGNYSSLLALMKSSDALYGSNIRIEGELGVAETLRSVVQQLDIDIESLLAPIMGGTAAYQIGRFFNDTTSWVARSADAFQLNTKEYLEDEANLLVPRVLADEFASSVNELREAADRVEARLRRLEQQQSSSQVSGKKL